MRVRKKRLWCSKDEMSRGYFDDMSEMKKHGGKISSANKIIIPEIAAVKFPTIEVTYQDGSTRKLPVTSDGEGSNKSRPDIPKVSLLCLSFQASSEVRFVFIPSLQLSWNLSLFVTYWQAFVSSWSSPFIDSFGHSGDVHLYEVSFIDKWLLCRSPIKQLLLKVLKKSWPEEQQALQRQLVYHFGDHYDFRKELRILNLLTGYIFLLDKFGRIRWQGTGLATQDELSSLMSCTSLLLQEK